MNIFGKETTIAALNLSPKSWPIKSCVSTLQSHCFLVSRPRQLTGRGGSGDENNQVEYSKDAVFSRACMQAALSPARGLRRDD